MQQSSNDKGNDKKPSLTWSTAPSTSSANNTKQQPSMPLVLPKIAPNNGNTTARYAGIFVGGLLMGVVVAWGWSSLGDNDSAVVKNTNTTATTNSKSAAASKASNSASVAAAVTLNSDIEVDSPQRAGQSVAIANVAVQAPTWVVVYDNSGGKPGNVLGAQLFFTAGGGTVTLLRSTMAGKSYFVGRSTDNGDRKFQKATDKPVIDESGNPIVVTFTAN